MIWLRRFLIAVISLLVLLASAGVWLASESGSRWLISLVDENITIGEVRGSLATSLELEQLTYHSTNQTFRVGQLNLSWDPLALSQGWLKITQLKASNLQITTVEGDTKSKSDTALELPSVVLPLRVSLQQVDLSAITRVNGTSSNTVDTSEEILANRIQFSADGTLNTVTLDQIQIDHPLGQLAANARLKLTGAYPLTVTSEWSVEPPSIGTLRGRTLVSGNLAELAIQQYLTGAVEADAKLTVKALEPDIPWNLTINNVTTRRKQWAPELPISQPHVMGSARGNRYQLQLGFTLQAVHDTLGPLTLNSNTSSEITNLFQNVTIDNAELLLGNKATISAAGTISNLAKTPSFDINGSWADLNSSLLETRSTASSRHPTIISPAGSYHLTGTINAYQISVRGKLDQSPDIPATKFSVNANGNQSGLQRINAVADTLDGEISAIGKLHWEPLLTWQVTADAKRLNPHSLFPEWPASLDFVATQQGSTGDRLKVTTELLQLSGTVRDIPVSASGKTTYQPNGLAVPSFKFTLANTAHAVINGTIGEQLDLKWQFNASPLPPLIESFSGSMTGMGRLTGSPTAPKLEGNLNGQKLRYGDFSASTLTISADITTEQEAGSVIRVSLNQPGYNDQRWQSLTATLRGTPANHYLDLILQGKPMDVSLSLDGSKEPSAWLATLNTLILNRDGIGPWQLRSPATLNISPEQLELSEACLTQEDAVSCVQAQRLGEVTALKSSAKNLPLSPFLGPYLPVAVEGTIDGNASIEIDGTTLTGLQASTSIHQARIEIEPELWFNATEIDAEISGDDNALDGKLDALLPASEGSVNATVRVSNPFGDQKLKGNLIAEIRNLQFITLLEPSIAQPKGKIAANITISGDAATPNFRGEVRLTEGRFEVPATAIVVEGVELSVADHPSDLQGLAFQGRANSGAGDLDIKGNLDTASRHLTMSVIGNRFVASNTKELKLQVSPQLEIDYTPDQISVTGDINVPEALLAPPKLDNRVSPSTDVVFVDEQMTQSKQRQQVRVRLQLGEDVHFEGFGIEADLQGNILLEDDNQRGTRATGTVQVASGQYQLYGQDLEIERGRFIYSAGPIDNPGLDLRIVRRVDDVTVGAEVGGTLRDSTFNLFSSPSMPDPELLSYLILGRPPGSGETDEQALAMRAAMALALSGGNKLGELLTEKLPVDELGLESNSSENTSFYVGKYLSPRLYVRYGIGLIEPTTTFFLRYKLSRRWSFESQTDTYRDAADLIYTIER